MLYLLGENLLQIIAPVLAITSLLVLPTMSNEFLTEATTGCDSSYPDICLPSSPDVNCDDLSDKGFTVLPPDPHGLDRDEDGIGCES